MRTHKIAPKTKAATIAALITPLIANLLGLDAATLLGLVTAVVTFVAAYWAPPSVVLFPEPDAELDDPTLPSEVEVTSLTEPPTESVARHSDLKG